MNERKMELGKRDFALFPELQSLDTEATWTLTKTGSKHDNPFVQQGQCQSGDLKFLSIDGELCAMVTRGFDYIRTSPIAKVISFSADKVELETEGGFYSLEKKASI